MHPWNCPISPASNAHITVRGHLFGPFSHFLLPRPLCPYFSRNFLRFTPPPSLYWIKLFCFPIYPPPPARTADRPLPDPGQPLYRSLQNKHFHQAPLAYQCMLHPGISMYVAPLAYQCIAPLAYQFTLHPWYINLRCNQCTLYPMYVAISTSFVKTSNQASFCLLNNTSPLEQ